MPGIPKFVLPSFLQDQDTDTIHQRMMGELPGDIDDTAAGFPWDFTRPAALEKAELLQFFLPQTLKMMFWMWATGEWLDYHAGQVGLTRKPAVAAAGHLLVKGVEGTVIPEGFVFATAATDDSPSILFQAVKESVIQVVEVDEDETSTQADVLVQAVEPGTVGNAPRDTVILMLKPMKGIQSTANPEAITGGTATEDDEELRQRIAERYDNWDISYVGNPSDYIRWAKEVPGVGEAFVIPRSHGPGTGTVVVLDPHGLPANDLILEEVYNHIMRPDDEIQRLAPIYAKIYVIAPGPRNIDISVTVDLEYGYDLEVVVERFRDALGAYYVSAKGENVVRYVRVASILSEIPGVKDFGRLLINSGRSNITMGVDEYPVTGEIVATEGVRG